MADQQDERTEQDKVEAKEDTEGQVLNGGPRPLGEDDDEDTEGNMIPKH